MNSDLKKQAQALEVRFSQKTKLYHSQTHFNNILRIYLNEKLNFYNILLQADIFKYLYFPSTMTDTSHIPSTVTLNTSHIPSTITLNTLVRNVQLLSPIML